MDNQLAFMRICAFEDISDELHKYCDEDSVTAVDETLLHYAVYTDRLDLVKYIIENNLIDVDSKTCNSETPLMLAVNENNPEILMELLENGADPDLGLYIACQNDNLPMVKRLIEAGGFIDIKEVDNCDEEIVEYLTANL